MTLNMAWLLMPDSISETPDLLEFSLETISRVDQEWPEKDKYPVSGHSEGENALLMAEVRGEWPDWFELTERPQKLKPC